jgi:hypothetical protein
MSYPDYSNEAVMNQQYGPRRKPRVTRVGWYRTLFRSYLYRPPVWVYLAELAVAAAMITLIIVDDHEGMFNVLTQVLWGVKQ